jgi:hypothetical protein
MEPKIDNTKFGSITIDGVTYNHDVIFRLGGTVEKRKKKLSKAIYGTSHILSLDEVIDIYEAGVEKLILGTGQYGMVQLSEEAANYLEAQNCEVILQPSPEALHSWNQVSGAVIGLFHITC